MPVPAGSPLPDLMTPSGDKGLLSSYGYNPKIRFRFFKRRDKGDHHSNPPPPVPPEDRPGFGGGKPPKCESCMQDAKWEVIVNEALKHRLFFCGHHFKIHEFHAMGYQGIKPVTQW